MLKPADTSVSLSPLIANRWSPRSFDAVAEISDIDIAAILEAGRWSPSSGNQQPWRFIVAKRGDSHFENLTKHFAGFNATWAPSASALILVVAVTTNDDGSVRPFALYDAGLASAFMTMEANHRGIAVHPIAGFNRDEVKTEFSLPDNYVQTAILVLGQQAPAEHLDNEILQEREKAPRVRLPLSEIVIAGLPAA
ncbi:MAG: nitroreductase family protein [Candidatus Planktophila sp.]|nr:nitroreductase family protein [Candidatus Planktophila sp.]